MKTVEPRIAAVRRWLAEGRSICPFATLAHRAGAIRYVQLRAFHRPRIIWRELRAFIEREEQAVVFVLTPPDPPRWEDAWALVSGVFEEIVVGMNRLNHPDQSIGAIVEAVARDRRLAEARERRRLPFYVWGGIPDAKRGHLFTVGMGPQYPAAHPRYAPHTILQCTWQGNVIRAGLAEPALQRRIDERMHAAVGGVYDGDELWLPIAPEVGPRRVPFADSGAVFLESEGGEGAGRSRRPRPAGMMVPVCNRPAPA